ncbi:hypothetical protein PV326_006382 [Microctonus aethiopoides]|nr:hypothetical protein PV326_006382 [Microctonus aethiopoides]
MSRIKTMAVTGYLDSNVDMNSVQISNKNYVMNNQDKIIVCSEQTLNNKKLNDRIIDEKQPFINNQQSPSNNSSKQNNGNVEEQKSKMEYAPPDGGIRAWTIMIGSFTINGILFSVINSYSLIFLELIKKLEEIGETEVNAKAALVGSLTIGTTFFLSPVAGILTDKIGIQMTTFIGGALAFGGMLLSSIFSHKVEILYLTYGVMYGLGASLAYTPSLVILGHYFKRRLGLVNGIVTAGSSVFTIIMPYFMGALLKNFGLEGTLRSLAILTSIVMMCAVLFKPIPVNDKSTSTLNYDNNQRDNFIHKLKKVINLSIWKKKRYVVWASAIPIALFGYFVPYVHIGNFVVNVFGPDTDKKLPVMCIGITSASVF